MKKILILAAVALVPSALFAQSVTVHDFTAAMSPSNENPAVDKMAFGSAHIGIKAYWNADGDLTQAKVDFNINYYLAEPEMLTGLHIHRGAAGANGPVVVNSGLSGPLEADAGNGVLFFQATVTDADRLEAVEAILDNPGGYYVNLHSSSVPSGFVRGQLQRTTLSMIQMTKAQSDSIEAKINAMQATLERIANRLGVVPVAVE